MAAPHVWFSLKDHIASWFLGWGHMNKADIERCLPDGPRIHFTFGLTECSSLFWFYSVVLLLPGYMIAEMEQLTTLCSITRNECFMFGVFNIFSLIICLCSLKLLIFSMFDSPINPFPIITSFIFMFVWWVPSFLLLSFELKLQMLILLNMDDVNLGEKKRYTLLS